MTHALLMIDGWDFSPHQLMAPAEVASAFKVDPKTVARWAMAGKLAFIRLPGSHRRYSREQIQALMRGETTPPVRQNAEATS